jgi:CHAT domain-containing protein
MANEGRFSEAHRALETTLAISQNAHDRYLEARARANVGFTLLNESRYDEAIGPLGEAGQMASGIGAIETAARTQGNLGIAYFRLGDFENARLCFDRAKSEFSRTGNEYEQQIWTGNEGNVFYETHDFRAAISEYKRALEMARRIDNPVWKGRWISNLAATSIELHEWDAAEAYYREARILKGNVNDAIYEANSLNIAARIAAGRDRFDEAESLFRKAVNSMAEDPTVALEARTGIADILIRRGRAREAEKEFRATIAAIDGRQEKMLRAEYKLSWLSSLIRFYRQYVDFLMARNEPEQALEVAESSRSRVLAGRSGNFFGSEGRTADDYRGLARQSGAVLLEYSVGESRSYLWVITPDGVRCHVLPSRSTLHPLIQRYRAFVTGNRNALEAARETGNKLYEALLAPAVRDARRATRFLIVPDEELYSLNFETLPGANGKYWIEQATVAIAPSLNYLVANSVSAPRRATPELLLIGDPATSLPQYPKLEFASQEIDGIAAAMPRSEKKILKGPDARPDAWREIEPGRFGFIHFSAHAAANSVDPLDSAVILSGPPDRCRLVARDVMAARLTAELVTVSACRSAGGKTYAGEGMVGFAWAFLKAGASNVIAGLWDVNDRSTTQLMTALYRGIGTGTTPMDALRSAKLALLYGGGSYAKPFYWAPFQLYAGRAPRQVRPAGN